MSRDLDALIAAALQERELGYEQPQPGRFFVTLPGTTKLRTHCWLVVGRHGLLVEAFVCRRPDDEHERVYRFLLRRNTRLYGVHYAIDQAGDIYLVGRVSLSAVTADELDRLLGQVVEAADGDFNTLLELGFANAIRREWAWRVSRGESLANLRAFTHLVTAESEAAVSEVAVSEAAVSEAAVSEAAVSEAAVSEAAVPEAAAPDGEPTEPQP